MTTYFPHPSGKSPSVSVPTEIYALLLSIFQLHEILTWGPMNGEYLPLVQRVRALNGLRYDAKAFVPPPGRSATAHGNSAGLGPKAPPGRPASMGPDKRKLPSGRRASMGVDESPAVPPPWWVLKARKRIIRRWRRINPRTPCPLLRDMPDDSLRDLDNELQQKVEAFLAQKSTPPPPPREESRPDRQPRTPPREMRTVDDDDKSLSVHTDDDDGEPPPALDALPAQPDDVDNEPTDDAAAADPDGSSMPDMNPRPSGGASLDNTAPPPAHSAALPTVLLPSSNKPMGRTTEDSARAPQKEEPRRAPACKIWSPRSCVSCGNNIPIHQCFKTLEVGFKCYICDGSQHKYAEPEKVGIMCNSRSGLQHEYAEPKRIHP